MQWTPLLFGSLTAVWMAGCGGDKRNNDTGAAAGAATDSGAVQSGAAGTATDTARTGSRMHHDTSATGKSNSAGAKSKIRSGGDSVPRSNQ